ncbi:hypothetical protein PSAC2689_100271 [Paraburkholderia sacchari]
MANPLTIFFFYHGDGGWGVFPPERNPLAMPAAGQSRPGAGNSQSRHASIGDVRVCQ